MEKKNPKTRVDGQMRYVNTCDVDKLSIIEIYIMFNKAGERNVRGFFYKRSCFEMDSVLFSLVSDSDLVVVCDHVDTSRIMYLYYDCKFKESQENVDYVLTVN